MYSSNNNPEAYKELIKTEIEVEQKKQQLSKLKIDLLQGQYKKMITDTKHQQNLAPKICKKTSKIPPQRPKKMIKKNPEQLFGQNQQFIKIEDDDNFKEEEEVDNDDSDDYQEEDDDYDDHEEGEQQQQRIYKNHKYL